MSDIDECCSVCFRRVGINTGDDGTPPVDLGRCAAPGGFECRAVGQAVAGYRRENEVLRSNSDHLSSENAALSSQVESMAMCIESLAEELAKPEDARLEADERLRVVRRLLEENGCDCPCDHHADERGPDCEVCLACRIGEAVGK